MFGEMKTPKTRAEFERAFHFSMEHPMGLPADAADYLYSIYQVRQLPNGRIDFLSVDERARLHANMSLNAQEAFRNGKFPFSDVRLGDLNDSEA